MVQGIFGGATSYEEQSLADIMEDLEAWTKYALDIKEYISECHTKLLESKFWVKIPFDFQMIITTTIRYCDTIVSDIKLVKKAIQEERITNKEVNLLNKIGRNSVNFNHKYGRTYRDDNRWKDYF